MSDEGMSDADLARYRGVANLRAGLLVPMQAKNVAALIARLDAAERERDALREALKGMVRGCDYSHFNDVELAAEAERYPSDWIDLITDARAALTANHSAPVVEE